MSETKSKADSFTTYAFRLLATIGIGYLTYQETPLGNRGQDKVIEDLTAQVLDLKSDVKLLKFQLDIFNGNFVRFQDETGKSFDRLESAVRYNNRGHRDSHNEDLSLK